MTEPVHKTIAVGTHVFVIIAKTGKVQEAIVSGHEWWRTSNPHHPVYYDLVDLNGEGLYASCTGNWNFNEVFLTPPPPRSRE